MLFLPLFVVVFENLLRQGAHSFWRKATFPFCFPIGRDSTGLRFDLTPLPLPLLKLQPPRNLIVAFLSFFHSKPVHLAGPRVPVAGSPAHCVA